MKIRLHDNDITIGDERRIEWIDLTHRITEAIAVDPLLSSLEPLWQLLESNCVAGCCGIDAFDFHPDSVCAAMAQLDAAKQQQCLRVAIDEFSAIDGEVLVSHRLNFVADKTVFLELLSHLDECASK